MFESLKFIVIIVIIIEYIFWKYLIFYDIRPWGNILMTY